MPDSYFSLQIRGELFGRELLPDWYDRVSQSQSWEALNRINIPMAHDGLCELLLEAGGLDLAQYWINCPGDTPQQSVAQTWLKQPQAIHQWDKMKDSVRTDLIKSAADCVFKDLTVAIWQSMTEDMKNRFMLFVFDQYPGEPFASIQRYSRNIASLQYRNWHRHRRDFLTTPAPIVFGYCPSTEVERLLLTMQDAGDSNYVQRLKYLIAQQERASQHITIPEISTATKIHYDLSNYERALVAVLMGKTRMGGFDMAALPPISLSTEAPPVFVLHPELEIPEWETGVEALNFHRLLGLEACERKPPETISIEQLLGVYRFRSQEIVLFERGINWYCRQHSCDKKQVLAVVLIHELGHWLMHRNRSDP